MDSDLGRVEMLLALLLIQQMNSATKQERALKLSLAGFSNIEIADLLGTTGPVIAQLLYDARKAKAKKKKQ